MEPVDETITGTDVPAPPGGRRFPLTPLMIMALVSLVDQIDVSVARGVLPILEDEWSLERHPARPDHLGVRRRQRHRHHPGRAGSPTTTAAPGSSAGRCSAGAGSSCCRPPRSTTLNLLVARAAMGIGQAVDDPASTSYLGDSYPARMRGRVFSLQQVSFFLGGGIGLALGGWVGETLGWRWAFAVVGVPGALVALAVFRLREPRRGEAELPESMTWDEIAALPARADHRPSGAEGLSVRQFTRLAATELISQLRMIFGIRTMRYVLVGVASLLFTVSGIGHLAGDLPRALLGHVGHAGHRRHRRRARRRRPHRHAGGRRVLRPLPPPVEGRPHRHRGVVVGRSARCCSWCRSRSSPWGCASPCSSWASSPPRGPHRACGRRCSTSCRPSPGASARRRWR